MTRDLSPTETIPRSVRRSTTRRWRCAVALCVVAVAASASSAAGAGPTAPTQGYDGHLEQANAWAIEQVNASAAWETTRGEDVTVGVVDTGMGEHPFFEGKDVLKGYSTNGGDEEDAWHDVASDPNDPEDKRGHGTGVAAMALLAAPDATILPVRRNSGLPTGFDVGGAGEPEFEAIRWAVDSGADVISMAWGQCCGEADEDFFMALQYAIDHDVVLVASAGNDPDQIVQNHAPAAFPGVVTVSGTARDGGPWESSSVGPEVVLAGPADYTLAWPVPQQSKSEDCSWCPGRDEGPGMQYSEAGGTSATAGWVAGVAALIRSAHPDMDANNVINRLIQTADDRGAEGRDDIFGYGVPDAAAAIGADVSSVDRNPLGYPLAVAGASRAAAAPAAAGEEGGGDDGGTTSASGGSGGSDVVPLLLVAVLAGALGGGAWFLLQRRQAGRHAPTGPSPVWTGAIVTLVVALVAASGTYVAADAVIDKTESGDSASEAGDGDDAGSDPGSSVGATGEGETAADGNPAAEAAQSWHDAYAAGDLDAFTSLTCENPWYRVAMNVRSLEDPNYPRPGFALILEDGWEADDYLVKRQTPTKARVEAGDLSIGANANEELALVMEDGEWKVCDFWLTGPWWQGHPEWEARWPHDDDPSVETF